MDALPHSTPEHWRPLEEHVQHPGSRYWQPQHVRFHDQRGGVHLLWSSRGHRKGLEPKPADDHALLSHHRRQHYRLIGFDFADISWWVAMLFLVGSVFWCVNGTIAYCGFDWTTDRAIASAAATAFLGGTTFFFGGYLSWVESLNPAPAITFSSELHTEEKRFVEHEQCSYHGLGQGRRHFGRHATLPMDHGGDEKKLLAHDTEQAGSGGSSGARPKWRWYGITKRDLHSLGYVANTIQFAGATIFWIAVLTGLPGILPDAGLDGSEGLDGRTKGLWDGLYWAPQIVAAPAFVISGVMFMVEEQESWWRIKPLSMGWHVGLWNAIGGLGFFLCGVFGLYRETVDLPYQRYGTALSTFWGSWSFLLGSYLQYLETLNKR